MSNHWADLAVVAVAHLTK